MQPELSPASVPSVALCAVHRELAAVAPCSRCGTFACASCLVETTPAVCRSCAERSADPLNVKSAPYSFGTAFTGAFKLTWAAFLPAFLLAAPLDLIEAVLDRATASHGGGGKIVFWLFVLLQIPITAAQIHLMACAADGKPRSAMASLLVGGDRFGHLFSTNFRAGFEILAWSLLLIVPGVMKALSYAVTSPIVVLQPAESPLEKSAQLTAGKRWSLFGLFAAAGFLCAAPLVVAGMISALVFGVDATQPLAADLVTSLVGTVVGLFFLGAIVSAYYGLRRSSEQRPA